MSDDHLTIMSYNILEPCLAEKWRTSEGIDPSGTSNWAQRAPQLAANIAHIKPDILCLQEVSAAALPALPEGMAYPLNYKGEPFISLHPDAHPDTPYGCIVAFNSARFRGTPSTILSGENNGRAASLVSLDDRVKQCTYFVLSTHLKYYDHRTKDAAIRVQTAQAGTQQLRQQLYHLDEWTGPRLMIVAGDFNMDPQEDAERATLMAQFGYLTTPARTISRPSDNRAIDFIYTLGCAPEDISEPVIRLPYPKASDHLPRVMRIRL